MLSKRLREARKNKKLTQETLAKIVNTKKTTISNYETGYSTPSNEMLSDLADALDITTDYLLGRTDNPSGSISSDIEKLARGESVKVSPNLMDDELKGLTTSELLILEEIKKHPMLFHDLQKDPEKKIKKLIKMWKFINEDLEDDDDPGDGFGELED